MDWYYVEDVLSGLDPGNCRPWVVRVLFKNSYKSFTKVRIGKSTSVLPTLQIPTLGPPLSNSCCRCAAWGGRARGSCDRLVSAGQCSNLTFVARRILSNQLRPWKSGDTGLTEFWQRVIKEREENYIHANLSEVSRQQIGCVCVCMFLRAILEHQVVRVQ